MKFSKIVVVPKLTMVEVDMHKYGLDEAGLRDKYKADHKDADSIFDSHRRQLASIELLRKFVPNGIYYRERFNTSIADAVNLVIAAGGDDHIKYVSHYVRNTPVLCVNTDPSRSRGELLEDNIEEAVEKLRSGQYQIIDQTRIEAIVNGEPHLLGMSNYVIKRVDDSFGNFRYAIALKKKGMPEPEDKDLEQHPITSAINVYTGLGTKDWTRGAGRYLREGLPIFASTAGKIAWVIESPHDLYGVSEEIIEKGDGLQPDQIKPGIPLEGNNYGLLTGEIKEGDELHLVCFKDGCAAAPDAINEHRKEVNSGYRVVFRVADQPLKQVRMIK